MPLGGEFRVSLNPLGEIGGDLGRQVQNVLVKRGERDSGNGASADGAATSEGGGANSAAGGSVGGDEPRGEKAGNGSGSGKGEGEGNAPQQSAAKPKPKKDWVRFDGAAMLLSSAGWSDDEDEEKEELISSEIEKFRQKQVRWMLAEARQGLAAP